MRLANSPACRRRRRGLIQVQRIVWPKLISWRVGCARHLHERAGAALRQHDQIARMHVVCAAVGNVHRVNRIVGSYSAVVGANLDSGTRSNELSAASVVIMSLAGSFSASTGPVPGPGMTAVISSHERRRGIVRVGRTKRRPVELNSSTRLGLAAWIVVAPLPFGTRSRGRRASPAPPGACRAPSGPWRCAGHCSCR